MSIILNLPPDLESKLTAKASERGLTLSDYVLHLLNGSDPPVARMKTGAELMAYWQEEGLVGSRPDIIDSSEHARTLRQQAESRRRG